MLHLSWDDNHVTNQTTLKNYMVIYHASTPHSTHYCTCDFMSMWKVEIGMAVLQAIWVTRPALSLLG